MTRWVERVWYAEHPVGKLLAPLGWLYAALIGIRRLAYSSGLLARFRAPVPVVIVGNLTVGGTGKTPLVMELIGLLKASGYAPGAISRGYGGAAKDWPQEVFAHSDPHRVGDEPVMIARRCACPVVVGPDRRAAIRHLLQEHRCDVIVSDDGLQHLALAGDIEICVVDGERRFGNGRCLPAGPLREPTTRLMTVDFVLANGDAAAGEYPIHMIPGACVSLGQTARVRGLDDWAGSTAHAVAGIGHPGRFFKLLRGYGIEVIPHTYPDHHRFVAGDILFDDGLPVIMTEKDALKCTSFAADRHWYVPLTVELGTPFKHQFLRSLENLTPWIKDY